MLALYEWLLAQDIGRVGVASPHEPQRIEAELRTAFPEPSLVASARAEMNAKLAAMDRRPARIVALRASWPSLRDRLWGALVPAATMARWLSASGAASHPSELGITVANLAADYRRARLIRRRYTILDCLEDLGWLDIAVESLVTGTGFWTGASMTPPPMQTSPS
jgi:glycerol-1-phosphate dehydrogenase [NAD(P)+]